jgi:hypothetical protein
MPGLWSRVPLALVRHPSSFLAVAAVAVLAALAATSVPVLRAAVESESLQGRIRSVSPLAAGLEVQTLSSPRAALAPATTTLWRTLSSLSPPVVTESTEEIIHSGPVPLSVVPMWRQGALAHVDKLTAHPGPGVWISNSTATTGLRPGDLIRFPSRGIAFRVAGIYRSLDADLGDPYWQNFVSEIRSSNPDAPPPPAFVLMSRAQFDALENDPHDLVLRRYEFGLDPRGLTLTSAKATERQFAVLRGAFAKRTPAANRAFGCLVRCQASSLLDSALPLAQEDVDAVSATISVLAALGLVVALAAGIGCGLLLNRQREDDVAYFHRNGVSPALYGARVLGESVVPAVAGAAAGLGLALLALDTLAPSGAIGTNTLHAALERGGVSCAAAALTVALGAALAFPREPHRSAARRHLRLLPWELVPLVASIVLLVELGGGSALAADRSGASHPRLTVFLAPVLLAVAIAGLAVRGLRVLLRLRVSGGPPALFLLTRRIAAGQLLVTAAVVLGAAAFGAFAFSSMLSASLDASVGEKAFVATGGDFQGFVDQAMRLPRSLPVAATIVSVDGTEAQLGSARSPVTVVAGDPTRIAAALARSNLRGPLGSLTTAKAMDALPALAVGAVPTDTTLWVAGKPLPVKVVARASQFPGAIADRPTVVVSASALRRFSRLADPLPGADHLLWAKGKVPAIRRALAIAGVDAFYTTTIDDLGSRASVHATSRMYGFFDWVGIGAAVLALASTLLYLGARQRRQRLASALAQRMGLARGQDALALALEAALIVSVCVCAGAVAAEIAASVVAGGIDPLADWAPAPTLVTPWTTLSGAAVAVALAAAAAGAAMALFLRRARVAGDLRA